MSSCQRERSLVLGEAFAHARGGVAGAGDPVPPRERLVWRGDRGKHVDHRDLAGRGERMPARQDRIVEVRRENHGLDQRISSAIIAAARAAPSAGHWAVVDRPGDLLRDRGGYRLRRGVREVHPPARLVAL